MRYQMKQKVWAWGDDYAICDAEGNEVFEVDGNAMSIGDKLVLRDMDGREQAYIEQKLLSFKPCYEIYRSGELFARVEKDFSFFKDSYTVDVPGPNDYQVEGDFWDHEYTFIRQGRTVAHVSKAFFSWSDTYGIDIEDGEDEVTILATAVVVDLVNDEKRRHR